MRSLAFHRLRFLFTVLAGEDILFASDFPISSVRVSWIYDSRDSVLSLVEVFVIYDEINAEDRD